MNAPSPTKTTVKYVFKYHEDSVFGEIEVYVDSLLRPTLVTETSSLSRIKYVPKYLRWKAFCIEQALLSAKQEFPDREDTF